MDKSTKQIATYVVKCRKAYCGLIGQHFFIYMPLSVCQLDCLIKMK